MGATSWNMAQVSAWAPSLASVATWREGGKQREGREVR